jgi:hypothetical protein
LERKPNPLKTVMGMTLFESFPFTLKNLRLSLWQATVIVTGVQPWCQDRVLTAEALNNPEVPARVVSVMPSAENTRRYFFPD